MQRAVLHGIGEPLLNKDLVRMVEHLKARNVTVIFNTNAVLLSERSNRALVSSGLDEMRVSMHGATASTYARIHGKPLFSRVVRNIRRFVQLQRELNAHTPRVSLWLTGTKENIVELPRMVKLAAKIGVSEVYLQRTVYYLDAEKTSGLLRKDEALFDDLYQRMAQPIAEAEAAAREYGVALGASGATDPRTSLDAVHRTDVHSCAACVRPWTTAYVTANGNCLPCCIGPFATTDYESLKMGNLFEHEFARIWNGERYRAWRKALLGTQPNIACTGCGTHWSL